MKKANKSKNPRPGFQAINLGGHRIKKAVVSQTIEDDLRHLQQEKILSLFGKVDFDPGYDYKHQRRVM